MLRLGLDHDSLARMKPDIITLSCTAYGHTGPWRAYGARARTVDAVCGLSFLTGYEDELSALAATTWIILVGSMSPMPSCWRCTVAARQARARASISACMRPGSPVSRQRSWRQQRGITRPRLGTAHVWKAPHNVYRCQGDDRWIAITVSTDDQWQRLRALMGEPPWATGAEIRHGTGVGAPGELDEQIGQWTTMHDNEALTHLLQAHGVPAGAVLTARDLVANAHLASAGILSCSPTRMRPAAVPGSMPGGLSASGTSRKP